MPCMYVCMYVHVDSAMTLNKLRMAQATKEAAELEV